MKTVLLHLTVMLEKSPIYIQHVKGTAFTTKQMIMGKGRWILHCEEIQLWQEQGINIRTFTRSSVDHLKTKCINRQSTHWW